MSNKAVDVLCLNGRREKLKYLPNTSVLQLLDQVCAKQKLDSQNYGLRHMNKPLDVSLIMKFTNLPNLAKLELYALDSPRRDLSVTVALQLDDGARLQEAFPSSDTLLSILKFWNTKDNRVPDINADFAAKNTAVCTYMNQQLVGQSVLGKTSLKSLGLLSGRAIIRFNIKPSPDESSSESDPLPKVESNTSQGQFSSSSKTSKQITKSISNNTSSTNQPFSNQILSQSVGSNKLVSSTVGFEWDGSATSAKSEKRRKVEEPIDAPGPPEPLQNQFSNFKFPEKNIVKDELNEENNEVPAIDPAQMRQEVLLSMPCDRKPVLFSLDDRQNTSTAEEPRDEFFQHTVEDVRQRLADLKRERKKLEDAPLLTKSMRPNSRQTKQTPFNADYKVVLRFQLPERKVIQGIFHPLEEICNLHEFIRSTLKNKNLELALFTSPPKTYLKDMQSTLADYHLCPAANVHIECASRDELLAFDSDLSISSGYEAAEILARDVMLSSRNETIDSSKVSEANIAASLRNDDTHRQQQSVSQMSSQPRNDGKKAVPKWLRLGK